MVGLRRNSLCEAKRESCLAKQDAKRYTLNKMGLQAYVINVLDGDTFEITGDTIRLEGVNAPGLYQAGGMPAKRKLESLVLNKYIEYEEKARDAYARMIAQVWVEGRNINALMKVEIG